MSYVFTYIFMKKKCVTQFKCTYFKSKHVMKEKRKWQTMIFFIKITYITICTVMFRREQSKSKMLYTFFNRSKLF